MNEAIKLAIWKGGYTPFGRIDYSPKAWILRRIKPHYHKHLLKPEFWQALGRALGNKEVMRCAFYNPKYREPGQRGCFSDLCEFAGYKDPQKMYLQFMEWNWEGKSPDEFFSNLIKDK